MTALAQLREALGPTHRLPHKLARAWRTVRTLLDAGEQARRMARLRGTEALDALPNRFQTALAAHEMLTRFIIPSNEEFYRHYEVASPAWMQLLRLVDDPPTMLDPIGLSISRDELIAHLLHVVHCSAGYDVALLEMFPDGLDELERQLELLVAGAHPRQEALTRTVERPDWHRLLLDAVRRYRADPVGEWRVITFEPPADCAPLLARGVERYGTPGRLLRYATTLPASPRAWWRARRAETDGRAPRRPAELVHLRVTGDGPGRGAPR